MNYMNRDYDIDRLGAELMTRQNITDDELIDICNAFDIPIYEEDHTPRALSMIYMDLYKSSRRHFPPVFRMVVNDALDTISKLISVGQIKIKTEEELVSDNEELNMFLDTFKII